MRNDFIMGTMRTAGATAVFTLGLFGLGRLEADSAPPSPTPLLPRAELNLHGGAFSVSFDRTTYAPGESPVLTLVAENPTTSHVRAEVTLEISSMQPASAMSRVMVLPVIEWSEITAVDLAPGARVVHTLATNALLTPEHLFSVQLRGETGAVFAGELEVLGTAERNADLEFWIPTPMVFPEPAFAPASIARLPVNAPAPMSQPVLINDAVPVTERRRTARNQTAG